MESTIRSQRAYVVNDWTLPAARFEKIAPYLQRDTGVCLALISLLSLGLWAAIWGVVAAWASVVLE